MNKYIKTDVEGLVKDPESGAILNVDNEKLEAYRKKKAHALEQEQQSKKVAELEKDIKEIKFMLQELLKSSNR